MKKKLIILSSLAGLAFLLVLFAVYAEENFRAIVGQDAARNIAAEPGSNAIKTVNGEIVVSPDTVVTSGTAIPVPDNAMKSDRLSPLNEQWRAVNRKDSFNEELQYYSTDNVVMNKQAITLIARNEKKADKDYTSGLIESNFNYLYGTFEFTISVPEGSGLFPAIWLMPKKDKEFPEIDIFEMIGSEPLNFYGVVHYQDQTVQKKESFCKRVQPAKTYKVVLVWTRSELSWFIDGECAYKTNKGVPDEYMYLIINHAVGGIWPGNPDEKTKFPAAFVIHNWNIQPEGKEVR